MARNGSGTYSLPAGNPVASGTVISSSTNNTTQSDIATALTNSVCRNGEAPFTADQPMGDNKITGLKNPTAQTDATNLLAIQHGTGVYGATVGGSGNAITVTLSPAITAYAAGQKFSFIAGAANTGGVTINFNGLGAKAITKVGTTALVANDILSSSLVEVEYDGTRFQLISPIGADPSGTYLPLAGGTLTGDLNMSAKAINEATHTEAAHATTSDIWTGGNTCLLSGSVVTFTDVADAPAVGAVRYVVANAAHVITDNSALEVDGNANYTCAVGDLLRFEAKTTSTFRVSVVAHGDGGGSGDAKTANPLSQFAATTSDQLRGVMSDEQGIGKLVFNQDPTLINPALGTPASGVATNLTGTASGLTAGNVTTNANLTGHITSTGNAAVLGSFTSAQLKAALTNETGSGAAVFAESPTLVTPALGTPASGVATNLTGTASGLTSGNVTTNANLTGHITSTGNAAVLGSFTSAQLATALTNETGSGAACFATAPTIVGLTATGDITMSGKAVNEAVHTEAAHATTSDIWTGGNTCLLSGSVVTFTDVADAPQAGAVRFVVANAAHVITDNSALEVDGNANYTCGIGDVLMFTAKTTSTFRVNVLSHGDTTGDYVPSAVAITGGTINGTTIGASTPAAATTTTLNTTGAVVFNEAGADVDFRVEGDTDANLLVVDASADKIGIRSAAPALPLEVECTARGIATTGTTPVGALRVGSPDNNIVMDVGITTGNHPYIQGSDKANLATDTTLQMNPNGGLVAFGGEVTATGFTGTLDGVLGGGTPAAATTTTLNTSGAVVHNDAGADVDFRVEGDTDPHLIFADASVDGVVIGGDVGALFNTVGGKAKLTVIGSSASTDVGGNTGASFAIVNTDQTDENTAGLHFARADTDDTPNFAGASIVAQFKEAQGASVYPSATLNFLTSTSQGSAPTLKMTLTEAGNLGIGTTAPAAKINVASGDGATAVNQAILSGGRSLGAGAVGGAGALLFTNSYWAANKGAALISGVDSGSSGGELTFSTTTNGGGTTGVPTERMRITNSGNIVAPQIAKGWCSFNGNVGGGGVSIYESYNVASLTDNGTGDYDVVWATDFADGDYAVSVSTNEEAGVPAFAMYTQNATTDVRVRVATHAGAFVDQTFNSCIAWGTQ